VTHPIRRYCPVQRCPNRTNGGPCREHAVAREHLRANFAWRRHYRRAPWKHLRRLVLSEEPFCTDCEAKGLVTPSLEIHHKQRPFTEAQFFDRLNLMALCTPCHSARTARGE
jgi:5-methylcytosine-specific restriction protein A